MIDSVLKALEGMLKLARERAGLCLSQAYKHSSTPLSWRRLRR